MKMLSCSTCGINLNFCFILSDFCRLFIFPTSATRPAGWTLWRKSLTEATWDTILRAQAYLHNTGAPNRLLHTDPEKGGTWILYILLHILYVHSQTPNRDIHILYIHSLIDPHYVTLHACTVMYKQRHTDHVYICILIHRKLWSCHLDCGNLSWGNHMLFILIIGSQYNVKLKSI